MHLSTFYFQSHFKNYKNIVFCAMPTFFKKSVQCSPAGSVNSDLTGKFPIPSSNGAKYLLVVYDYDSNCIFAEPLVSHEAKNIVDAFKKVIEQLKAAGLTPQFQRLDNEISKQLKDYLAKEAIDFQLAPPDSHRRNAAERAIHTFKNHFIAMLCSCDHDFPLHLWCRLLPQAFITLNLLRGSRINPKLSAYAQVKGQFDYNRTPIGPPGTRVQAMKWLPNATRGPLILKTPGILVLHSIHIAVFEFG